MPADAPVMRTVFLSPNEASGFADPRSLPVCGVIEDKLKLPLESPYRGEFDRLRRWLARHLRPIHSRFSCTTVAPQPPLSGAASLNDKTCGCLSSNARTMRL